MFHGIANSLCRHLVVNDYTDPADLRIFLLQTRASNQTSVFLSLQLLAGWLPDQEKAYIINAYDLILLIPHLIATCPLGHNYLACDSLECLTYPAIGQIPSSANWIKVGSWISQGKNVCMQVSRSHHKWSVLNHSESLPQDKEVHSRSAVNILFFRK